MGDGEPSFTRVELDAQTVVVPTLDDWDALLAAGVHRGRALGVGRLAEQYVALARSTPGLLVGLGEDPAATKPWWVFHLVPFRGEPGYARVHVERQRCEGCAWSGPTGNPRVLALYLGTPDPLAALTRWSAAPSLPCPRCATPFPHPPLWVGDAGLQS